MKTQINVKSNDKEQSVRKRIGVDMEKVGYDIVQTIFKMKK